MRSILFSFNKHYGSLEKKTHMKHCTEHFHYGSYEEEKTKGAIQHQIHFLILQKSFLKERIVFQRSGF